MGSSKGKVLLKRLIFENNIGVFFRLLKIVEEIKVQNGLSKIVYEIEPTGNYHKPLAGHLIKNGYNLVPASIEDPFRFENRKQLIKMAGYDLGAKRSGRTIDKAIPVISKKGNGELRYALYQAAKVASSKVDLFRTYFTKLLRGREREREIKTKMCVKLAAKILIIVYPVKCKAYLTGAWTLMKRKESFNPDYIMQRFRCIYSRFSRLFYL